MGFKTYICRDLFEYIELLQTINTGKLWFRGQSNANFRLTLSDGTIYLTQPVFALGVVGICPRVTRMLSVCCKNHHST